MALKPQQAIPINLPVSYFPEGSTTVFVEIWLHTDLDILSKECKLHKSKPTGHIHQYVRENQSTQCAGAIFELDQKFQRQNCLF